METIFDINLQKMNFISDLKESFQQFTSVLENLECNGPRINLNNVTFIAFVMFFTHFQPKN